MQKKLAAMLVGAIMAAMPLAGSVLAADYTLGDFPAPFVSDGTANFLIVIGSGGTASGIAQDLAGLINVAVRLGGETVTTEGGEEVTVTGGTKVESPNTDLTYNDAFNSALLGAIGPTRLPVVLADGVFEEDEGTNTNEADYSQEIEFNANSPAMVFDIDEDQADKPAGTYVFFDKDYIVYTYTLNFEDDVTVANADDMQDTEIVIQGKTYTISSITLASNQIDTMELLGGAAETTIKDGETVTVTVSGTSYDITADIYENEAIFTVEYSGSSETTDALGEGDTYTLDDDTEIGVRDILYSAKESKASSVTIYVGAQKITLEDGDAEVKINGEASNDYEILSDFNDDSNLLEWIEITVQPDEDMWLAEDDEWVDPVFGAWKITYTGITETTEEFKWDSTGEDEAYFTFINVDGKEVVMPVGIDTASDDVAWGDPDQSQFWDNAGTADADGEGSNEAGMALTDNNGCRINGVAGLDDECNDFLFLGISSGGEAHVFRVEDVDRSGDQIKLRDETLGKDLEDGDWIDCSAAIDTDIGDITIDCAQASNVTLNFTNIDLTSGNTGDVVTVLAGILNFGEDGTNNEADVIVEDADANQDTITFDDDGSDKIVIDIDAGITMLDIEDDSDKQVGLDAAGWGIIYTNEDSTEDTVVTAEYPEEEAILNAYILESAGTLGGTTSGVGRSGVIKSNVAVVDTDVTSTQKSNYNLILGGGPAVNKMTAEALGLTYPTYGADTGIPENGYMIKLVPDAFVEGKYALVIAGWEAEQTTEAMSKVQANMASQTGLVYYYPAAPTEETTEA